MIGTVLDDSTGVPLENVNVFLAQTTLGSNTGVNGGFEIKNIPPGAYDFIASRLGYNTHKVQLSLPAETRPITVRLHPVSMPLAEVIVSSTVPTQWLKQLERFRKMFLGSSLNAKECKIINPEVLDFTDDGERFSASARAPLEIENDALGYRVFYILRVFHMEPVRETFGGVIGRGYALVYDGSPRYFELETSEPDMLKRWKKNRMSAYEGSQCHFLSALVRGSWEEDGFIISVMPELNIHNTPINREAVTPRTIDRILTSAVSWKEKTLEYQGVLEIEYTRKRLDPAVEVLRKQGTESPVSWLRLNHRSITINSYGLSMESLPTTAYGYWSWQRFADKLPLDYQPEE